MRIATLLIFLASCAPASDDTVKRAAEAAGLTDVKPTGIAPLSCSDGDFFRAGFTAKNVKGHEVKGTVCCGWLKNCTVRYE